MEEKDNLLEDITRTGYLNYSDLQKLNDLDAPPTTSYDKDLNPIRPLTISEDSELQNQRNLRKLSNIRDYTKPREEDIESAITDLSLVPLLDSKYDRSWAPYKDIEENRAQQQSAGRLLLYGLGKMGELALSTAADNIVGSIAGVANVISEAAQGNISGEHWFRDSLNAFVYNPVSRKLLEVNKWTEEVLPNYYTKTQLNRSWYLNLFTANFIGDHFLKNTGFMVGALMGARATGSAVSKLMGIENSRNIFKGMAAAAGMNDMSAAEVAAQLAKEGVSTNQVTLALAQSAKKLSRLETALKLIAGLGGSWGESRVEALNGADEMFDKYSNQFNLDKEQLLNLIDGLLMLEHPELFILLPVYGDAGEVLGYNVVPDKNNSKYAELHNKKVDEIYENYDKKMLELTNRKIEYANNSFLVNFALTYLENLTVFGDAITGGYTSAKNSKLLTQKIGKKVEAAPIEQYMRQQSKDLIKKETRKNIAKGIWSPIFEGTLEMFQRGEQLGEEIYQMSKFNTFAGEGTSLDGVDKTVSWIEAFFKGLGQTYSDPNEWENFALGFLTAMLPMGHAEVRRNPETGKIEYDLNGRQLVDRSIWGGTFWDNILWANKQLKADASELEKAINDVLQNANKVNLFLTLVRDEVFAQRRNQALEEGNVHNYKSAEFDKFINMALTFQKLGLLEDFEDLVNTYYTIETPELVEDLRKNTIISDENQSVSFYDGWTDQEIIDYFAKAKNNALATAKQVNKLSKDFDVLFGDRVNDLLKTEMLVSTLRIDDRERRIRLITLETIDVIKEKVGTVNNILGDLSEELEFLETIKSLPRLLEAFDDETIDKINDKLIKGGTLSQAIDKYVKEELNTLNSERALRGKKIKALEKKEKANTITASELSELENLREKQQSSKITYNELTEHFLKLKELDALPITFDVKKIEDLRNLIAEREGLITEYYYFGNQTKAFPFETFFANDIGKTLNAYAERKAQKAYSEFKETRDINLLNKWFVNGDLVLNIAENLKDESTASYLKQAIKYSDYLDPRNTEKNKKIPLGDVSPEAINLLDNSILESLVEKNELGEFLAVNEESAKAQVLKGINEAYNKIRNNMLELLRLGLNIEELIDDLNTLVKSIQELDDYNENLLKQLLQKSKQQDDKTNKGQKEGDKTQQKEDLTDKQKQFVSKSKEEIAAEIDALDTWSAVAGWLGLYDLISNSDILVRYHNKKGGDTVTEYNDSLVPEIVLDFNGNPSETKDRIKEVSLELHDEFSNEEKSSSEESSEQKGGEEEVSSSDIELSFDEDEASSEGEEELSSAQSDEVDEIPIQEDLDKQDEDLPNTEVSSYNDETRIIPPITNELTPKEAVPPMTTGTLIINTNQGNSNAENSHFPQTPLGLEDALSVGRRETLYDINDLKKGKATPRSSEFRFDLGLGIWTTKGREFVENGDLNRLLEYWAKTHNGQKLPIRLVRIHHGGDFNVYENDATKNAIVRNKFYRDALFAAVEIPKGFKPTDTPSVKTYEDGLGKIHKELYTTVTDEAKGGERTSMLILGMITASKDNPQLLEALKILNDSKVEGQKGKPLKGAVNLAYDNQLEILLKSHPDAEIKRLDYFSPKLTLNLEWIFSGRIIKSNERNPKVKERDFVTEGFNDCVLTEKEYKQLSEKYTPFEIAVIAASEITFGNLEVTEDTVTVAPNTFRYQFYNSLLYSKANNLGTIWIKTKESDGRIYYKGVKLKAFDSSYTIDFDLATQENSPIAARLKQAIVNMVETNRKNNGGTLEEWKQQLAEIQRYIYVPKTLGKRMFISKEGFSITKSGKKIAFDSPDAARDIYELIRSTGYTFTLGLDLKLTLKEIIDSNILTTDLALIHNAGASFLVSSVAKGVNDSISIVPSQMAKQLREGEIQHTGISKFDPTRGLMSYITVAVPEMANNKYYVTLDEKENRVWFLQKGERREHGRDTQITDASQIAILDLALFVHNVIYDALRNSVNRVGVLWNIVNQRNLYKGIKYSIIKGRKMGTDSNIYFPFKLGGNDAYMDLNFKVYSPSTDPNIQSVYTLILNLTTNSKTALELLSATEGKKAISYNKGIVVDEDLYEEIDENIHKIGFKRKNKKGEWQPTYIDVTPEDLYISEEYIRSVLGDDVPDEEVKEVLKLFIAAPRIRIMSITYDRSSNTATAAVTLRQEDGKTRYEVDGDTFLGYNGLDATFKDDDEVPINLNSNSPVGLKDLISRGSIPFKMDWTPGEIIKEKQVSELKKEEKTKTETPTEKPSKSLLEAFGDTSLETPDEESPSELSEAELPKKETSEEEGEKPHQISSPADEDPFLSGNFSGFEEINPSSTLTYGDGTSIDIPDELVNTVAGIMEIDADEVTVKMLEDSKKVLVSEVVELYNSGQQQEAIQKLKDNLFC